MFELQGHRGCRGLRPENTLPGFQAAIDLGVASIETDVQRTRDGVLVLYHDFAISDTICRRVDPDVPDPASRPLIRDLTVRQLQGYAADRNPDPRQFSGQQALAGQQEHPWRIPTLAEFLGLGATAAGLIFDLEIKRLPFRGFNLGIEEDVVAALRAAGVMPRARVRSFDHRVVRRVRELEPALETAILVIGTAPIEPAELARQAGAVIHCPNFEFLDETQVRQCHDAGIRVIPWAVNELADMKQLLGWGVDGITTDYPDRLKAVQSF